jgi:hypothetical protein
MSKAKTTRLYKQVFVLGIVIIIGAGYFLARSVMMISSDIKTTATVIKIEQMFKRAGETTSTYIPTVQYTTGTGKVVTMSTGFGSSMYNFDVGEKVTVYYDEKNPTSFNIVVPLSTWALPVIGLLFGCLILWSARKL